MPSLPEEIAIEFDLDEPTEEAYVRKRVASALRISVEQLPPIELRKKSIDARKGRVRFHLLFEIGARADGEEGAPLREVGKPKAIVVGDGPAGLFCAYELARHGVGSIVLDRGKTVQPRRHDLAALNKQGIVDPDSNYCFGEGGAGTYSDGKLYTRAHKRGNVRDVIEILAKHGAPDAILTDARPHIGSNRLPQVVSGLREALTNVGVEFRFGAKVIDLVIDEKTRTVRGVRLENGDEVIAECVVLATGHSASDIYEMLEKRGVALEAKSFALGVRIEHPQALINKIQYGAAAQHPSLPAAPYRVAETVNDRGVFSFCMCPGGFIVPASTEPRGLVVNGMSLSRRSSHYANSGLVVGVEPEDVEKAGFKGVMGGIGLQRKLEALAFEAGGGKLVAPATRVSDFVAGKGSSTLPATSYLPGLFATDLAPVLDGVGLAISTRIAGALRAFDKRMRGYLTSEAILVGVESRTSSPVRIVRDSETLESPSFKNLYPTGEGAGYAGGIMSAAMDGMRVAREVVARIEKK